METKKERSTALPLNSGPSRPLSILLVDDTPANQKAIAGALQRRGHSVGVANNGREAVARLNEKNDRFQIVLMDVQMPDMDGYAATAAIRNSADAKIRSIPIVGMTAQGDRDRCLQAGMNDYIAKPIDVPALVALVENILGPGGSAAPAVVADDTNTTHHPDDTPVLNLKSALRRLGGDTDLLRNFVDVYHEDAPGLLAAIHQAIDGSDGPTLHRAAHSLKGLAANFDAIQVVDAAGRLEQMGQSASFVGAKSAVEELERAIARFDEALAKVD